MPLLGVLTLAVPFVELFQPGQPLPYSVFPYASVAILLLAVRIRALRARAQPARRRRGGRPQRRGMSA